MKKTILMMVIGLFILSISVYAQTVKIDGADYIKVEKIVQRNGWKIPDLSKESPKDQDVIQKNEVAVKRMLYSILESEILENYTYYYSNQEDKTIKIETHDCDLRDIISYSVDNKVFAYSFTCVPFGDRMTDPKTGKVVKAKAYVGILLNFYCFDEDGDGKFETKYITNSMPQHIPDWVKKSK